MSEVVLIDLSSILHPLWHMCQADPDSYRTSTDTVAKVRALATGQPYVAVCCDSGRSFRRDIDPTYKGHRPEVDAALVHQGRVAQERLLGDGFPVWSAPGFEADDLIGTACKLAREAGHEVLVVSADKDLLQLVGEGVKARSPQTGNEIDEAGVLAKFGVAPWMMTDYLALVGDTSDNIKGAKGIGPKRAATLLGRFGSVEALYEAMAEHGATELGLKPSETDSLVEFRSRYPTVRSLVALRTDVPIPFSELFRERIPKEATEMQFEFVDEPEPAPAVYVPPQPAQEAPGGVLAPEPTQPPTRAPGAPPVVPELAKTPPPAQETARAVAQPVNAIAVRPDDVLPPAPAEWSRALEPMNMAQARQLAQDMFSSRLWSAYGSPAAVLSTILTGRELGLEAMASLRAIHIIEGKSQLAADLIRALVLRSKLARYFRPVERTPTRATFETQRGDDPPVALSYTIEEGRAAFQGDDKAWAKSGWGRNPADMCVARAGAKLARLVYPEVAYGLYAPEEFD